MATRSIIAKLEKGTNNTDDTILAIYCHHDGYLKHNGVRDSLMMKGVIQIQLQMSKGRLISKMTKIQILNLMIMILRSLETFVKDSQIILYVMIEYELISILDSHKSPAVKQ